MKRSLFKACLIAVVAVTGTANAGEPRTESAPYLAGAVAKLGGCVGTQGTGPACFALNGDSSIDEIQVSDETGAKQIHATYEIWVGSSPATRGQFCHDTTLPIALPAGATMLVVTVTPAGGFRPAEFASCADNATVGTVKVDIS